MIRRALVLIGLALLAAACGRQGEQAKAPSTPLTAPPPQSFGAPSPTLKAVKARGVLNCGVNPGLAGFALPDAGGRWRGFDADFCRAIAAAALGDPQKVSFIPLSAAERFGALRSGKVDLLARNTSWTLTSDTAEGADFAGVNYYDGQGFLVRKALNLQSATELSGARICVQAATTTALNLNDFLAAHGLNAQVMSFPSEAAARGAYADDKCDAFTADISALAGARALMQKAEDHVILPDAISKEPLGLATRTGDAGWTDLVRWTLNSLILAEELGVRQRDVDEQRKSSMDPEVRRLLGVQTGLGGLIGLDDAFAYRAIKAVGNYGEVFDRNLGQNSALKLQRGLNAQWNASPPGLIYALPLR